MAVQDLLTASSIFWGTFSFTWFTFLWEFYLEIRQYRKHVSSVSRPPEAVEIIDLENYDKARAYSIDKMRFHFVKSVYDQVESSAVLLLVVLPLLWSYSLQTTVSLGFTEAHEIVCTIVFFVISSFLSTVIGLPWSVYKTFVVEQKHGFNKQTVSFFAFDQVKFFVLQLVLGGPIIAILVKIIQIGGPYLFAYLWGICSLLVLFLMTVYPEYIAPLFDKYTPLPAGELRSKIEALASRLDFPLKKLYVVEGSKRSSHSNAYLYGFFNNKRIVLFDTLLESCSPINEEQKAETAESETLEAAGDTTAAAPPPQKKGCTDDEVVAVLGHELGHWAKSHNVCNIVIAEVNMLFCFSVFGLLYQLPVLFEAFGFVEHKPVVISLIIILQFIFAPYNYVLSFLMTCLVRRMEFQADEYSTELGYGRLLCKALIKLGRDNLSMPVDDWLYSSWHHDHPPILERIRTVKEIESKAK